MRVEAAVRLRRHRVDLALVGVQLVVEPAVVRAAPVPGRVQVLQAGLVEPGPVVAPGHDRRDARAVGGDAVLRSAAGPWNGVPHHRQRPGQKSPCGRWVRNELYRYQPPTW